MKRVSDVILWSGILAYPLQFIFAGPTLLLFLVTAGATWMLLYRCWMIIQDGEARTTPGRAVGFLFVPFFNLYWIHVVTVGLAEDMNRYCEARKIGGLKADVNLARRYNLVAIVEIVLYAMSSSLVDSQGESSSPMIWRVLLLGVGAVFLYFHIQLMRNFANMADHVVSFKSEQTH